MGELLISKNFIFPNTRRALPAFYNLIQAPLTLLALLSLLFINSRNVFAQDINLGVPASEAALNIFKSDHPFAKLIKSASTQPLLRIDTNRKSGLQLVLADSFSVGPDGKSLELRLRPAAAFVNSKLVNEVDLNASFANCLFSPDPDFIARFKVVPELNVFRKADRVYVFVKSTSGLDSLYAFIDSCPILEEQSLRLFGEDLGSANLLLGTGPYNLVSRTKNREARLERIEKNDAWATTITLRSFGNAGQALTALQTGTIDAFYTQDQEIENKVVNDPTLLIDKCGVYNIILRKGLEIRCPPYFNPGTIRYSAL